MTLASVALAFATAMLAPLSSSNNSSVLLIDTQLGGGIDGGGRYEGGGGADGEGGGRLGGWGQASVVSVTVGGDRRASFSPVF